MMKKLLILVCVVAMAGCYKDTEEELYPDWGNTGNGGGCDTTDVSFVATIKPILDQACAIPGCHDAVAKGGGYDFTVYAGVNLAKSRLEGAIKQMPGYAPMPQGGPRLNSCQVDQITAWIREGAKNN